MRLLILKSIYALISLVAIIFGVFFLVNYYADPSGSLPSHEDLSRIEGKIAWVQNHRYGVRFGLLNDERKFNYPSKAREVGRVRSSLKSASGKWMSIFVDLSKSNSPLNDDRVYFTVYEIRIDDSVVRSYAEVSEAWMSDQRLVPYLGIFFILGGSYIFWLLRKRKIPTT